MVVTVYNDLATINQQPSTSNRQALQNAHYSPLQKISRSLVQSHPPPVLMLMLMHTYGMMLHNAGGHEGLKHHLASLHGALIRTRTHLAVQPQRTCEYINRIGCWFAPCTYHVSCIMYHLSCIMYYVFSVDYLICVHYVSTLLLFCFLRSFLPPYIICFVYFFPSFYLFHFIIPADIQAVERLWQLRQWVRLARIRP